MRVFLTGATGFIGSHLVPELKGAGHHVIGLTRSNRGAEALVSAGAESVRGDVNDLELVRKTAAAADAVIHAAFNHDFAKLRQHSEEDRRVIEAIGEVLTGSDRPFIVTSGTGLARRKAGDPAVETDAALSSAEFARGASEEAAEAVLGKGVHVVVVRLSQVHDPRHQGRIAQHILLGREKGRVCFVGEGRNRLAAVHVSDAVRLYRLALEQGRPGERFHAVDEEGVPMRDIAAVIGAGLNVPVQSITPEEAPGYFGWLADLAQIDLSASSEATRARLGWEPTGPGLLSDLRAMEYA